jgi:catechol 2,3-dioxygenase-like lactoylglutathione lyase family enzyme
MEGRQAGPQTQTPTAQTSQRFTAQAPAPTPELAGVHHLKLPVSDLDRSLSWYATRLGYQVVIEFRQSGRTGVSMTHPNGGPWLGLVLDPDRARAAAGFDYFSIGVRDREQIEALAAHLTALGEQHAGVHFATIGWILPMLHDPDGHEVRFYSIEAHTGTDPAHPLVIDDAVATARAREADWLAERASAATERGAPS